MLRLKGENSTENQAFSGSGGVSKVFIQSLVQRGLDYEKDRDGKFLSRFGAGSGDDKSYARAADRLAGGKTDFDTAERRSTGAESQYGAAKREAHINGIEHGNSALATAFSGKYAGDGFSGVAVSTSSGVKPGKSGNKVADELAWELYKSNLEESRKAARANQKYLLSLAEQDAAERARKAADEQAEKTKQKQDDALHEQMVRIAEGFGFAMKTKIKTTEANKDGTVTIGKKTRRGIVAVSGDAAPGCN
ncbi:hypothetical protein [Pseudomonas sp. Marseille-P8916]|nr:hypothetical protein [Pseudomonas sp. Marseille-P8916]